MQAFSSQEIDTVKEFVNSIISKIEKFFGKSSTFWNVHECLQYGHDKENSFLVWASDLIDKMQLSHIVCPQGKTRAVLLKE